MYERTKFEYKLFYKKINIIYMKIIYILFFFNFIIFSSYARVGNNVNLLSTEQKVQIENAKPIDINKSISISKEDIQNYIKPISELELQNSNILFYEFHQFDNPLCLNAFEYLMNDTNVIKVGTTKEAFAIIIQPAFNKSNFEEKIKNLELSIIPISCDTYKKSMYLINNK